MNIGEILNDALAYPTHHVKSLVIYAVLAIVGAFIGGASVLSIIAAASSTGLNVAAFTGVGLIGIIVFIIILFLIDGYALDIVKYGIERKDEGPEIDFGRQVSNAVKLIVVAVVYYVIPLIITIVLSLLLRGWLTALIGIILFIVFSLANFMAKCRLAKTDNLGEALAIGEAIGDISKVGLGKILGTVILVVLIGLIVAFIIGMIGGLNGTIGSILLGIFSVYYLFFYNRAIGLLYSDV